MKPLTTEKKLQAHAIVRLARAATVLACLTFTILALPGQAQAQDAPRVITFPNAPGAITVVWEHSGQVEAENAPPFGGW